MKHADMLCDNAGQSGGDFITLKHFKKRNRKMLKMLLFQPPKCSSVFLMDKKDKKGKKKELTLWINPAEWMYCSTGGVAGVQGEERQRRWGSTVQLRMLLSASSESEEPASTGS